MNALYLGPWAEYASGSVRKDNADWAQCRDLSTLFMIFIITSRSDLVLNSHQPRYSPARMAECSTCHPCYSGLDLEALQEWVSSQTCLNPVYYTIQGCVRKDCWFKS